MTFDGKGDSRKSAASLASAAIDKAKGGKSPRAKLNGKRTTEGKKGATGRIDRDGSEKVIEMAVLKKNMGDLGTLHARMRAAQVAFREKVKGVAEKSGLLASTVRAVVVASAGGVDVVAEKKRSAEQLQLALDGI